MTATATAPSRALALAGLLLLAGTLALSLLLPDGLFPELVQRLLYGSGACLLVAAALRTRATAACDSASPALRQRYLREFFPAMALYVFAVVVSVWLLKRIDAPLLRAAVALLPMPAVAMVLRAMVRYIRDADELQRRIEVEALAIATAGISLAYFAAGLLQAAKVIAIPGSAALISLLPLVCPVYGLAKVAVSRSYA